MSCFNLPKKLKQLPSSSKKVWNSFTSSMSPKLRTLRNKCSNTFPRTLSKTATRLFDCKRRRFIPRSGGGRARARDFYNSYNQRNDYQHLQPYTSGPNSPATVYIDRLFGMSNEEVNRKDAYVTNTTPTTMEDVSSASGSNTTVQDDNGGGGNRKKVKSNKNKDKNKDEIDKNNWKEYISSMPKIKGVDERAEEFISKFRQDMQIQREQSLIEFQKMLARSA